jgi:hypothetical protein
MKFPHTLNNSNGKVMYLMQLYKQNDTEKPPSPSPLTLAIENPNGILFRLLGKLF